MYYLLHAEEVFPMKLASTVARYLLGSIFFVFGLNGFLHFLPAPPPTGLAGQFFAALYLSHYLVPIFLLQIGPAVMLLINRYVPLALTLLGPIVVNILFFHLLMAPSGLPLAATVTTLWILTAFSVRKAFSGLFQKTYSPTRVAQAA
jgi:putative oxidoreductase